MGFGDRWSKKMCQITCDKIEWNRKILRIRKSFKEIEKVINCEDKKKK